ncbi:MAG: SDR family NAD(P)-dependent oxidoreductase, partial [Bradymonadaceae bacterium]
HEQNTPDEVYRAARRTYHLARAWSSTLGGTPGKDHFFVSITGMGGRLGFDHVTTPLPLCGAICGITKSLAREWEQASVRVIDVAREGFYPELGLQILSEAFHESPVAEVGLIGGIRYVPVLMGVDDVMGHGAGGSVAPSKESVVLLTGGGRGITAEVACDLARRYGCTLAIVGRRKLSHPNPLQVDMEAEKERVRAELAKNGERVTPLMVRQGLSGIEAQRTIVENMQRMRALGSEVEYFACDVSDSAQVFALLDAVRARFGRIDGVIHGAGVEESKLLADKDAASFDRVFRGKALGGLHLWHGLRGHGLKFFVAFSSIAGRFGNAGQTDYSAANEVLSKLAVQINATTKTRALSIDWTAWADVGMAVEGSMKTILESRGVEFLPPEVGAPMVADALELGLTGECVVAGELGELGGAGFIDLAKSPMGDTPYPALVDGIVEKVEGQKIIVERIFDPEQDYFIDDHVYEGVPVLPGVMGYELMISAAKLLVSGDLREVRDVRFERAVKLHRREPLRLMATAEVVSRIVGEVEIDVVIESIRTGRTGRPIHQEHYRARVVLGHPAPVTRLVDFDASETWSRGPDRTEVYKRFFHTGVFQVLTDIPWMSEKGVVGYGRLPVARLVSPGRSGEFLTDPLVREMAFQTAGLWGMINLGQSFLPLGIGRCLSLRPAGNGEEICIRCHRRDDAETGTIAFDVEILAEDGDLLQVMEKVELVGHRNLIAEEKFDHLARPAAQFLQMSEPEARLLLSDRQVDLDDILSRDEREAYERLKSPRRRAEWMAARVAAKELVRRRLRDLHGCAINLGDILIIKDTHGAPHIQIVGDFAQLVVPHLSITHSGGVAIAALAISGGGHRLGIDLETIEKRNESFTQTYFLPEELTLQFESPNGLVDAARLTTALWTAKEAVMKALGLGMHLRPEEIVVTAFTSSSTMTRAHVRLEGRAAETFENFDGRDLEVELVMDGRRVRSLARFIAGQSVKASLPATSGESLDVAAAVAALLEHKNVMNVAETKEKTWTTS